MTDAVVTWEEEKIETWLPEKGLVYVRRWVPDFAPYGGRRNGEHPSFEQWLDDMRAAGADLEGPTIASWEWYDMTRYGVAGHRPWTHEERAQYAAQLAKEIEFRQYRLDALVTNGPPQEAS